MGRYVMGDFEYKFWFASQGSDDITKWFGQEDDESLIHMTWERSQDLKNIEAKLKSEERIFARNFSMTVDEFFKSIETKGYLKSTADDETNTNLWARMCVQGSFIDLGRHIKKALEKQESVCVQAEC